MTYPEGSSVDDNIPTKFTTVQHATIQDAISFIKTAESIVFMAKVDIESVFTIIPVALRHTFVGL